MAIKLIVSGAIEIGIDGDMWFVSNGSDLMRNTFIFAPTLREALNEWNSKRPNKDYLYPASDEYEQFMDMPAEQFLNDDTKGFWHPAPPTDTEEGK